MAIEFEAKLKKWGRSFGLIVPMEKIIEAKINENDKLEVVITRDESPLRKHFGTHKFRRPRKKMLKEGDEESWDE